MRRRIAAVAAPLAALTLAPGCSPKAPANASDMNLLIDAFLAEVKALKDGGSRECPDAASVTGGTG